MFQTQGDAIMSGPARLASRPEPATPADEDDMIRFGLRGKKEEANGRGGWRAIRAHASAAARSCWSGMPGSGKSAVGRRLAARLDLAFVDADEEIERAAGKPIMDIFKDHGEAYFREGERKVIARLLGSGPQVLATGGGALMAAETRDNIRRSGISIWLKAELPVLMRRVLKRNTRPLPGKGPGRRHAPADGDALSDLRSGGYHRRKPRPAARDRGRRNRRCAGDASAPGRPRRAVRAAGRYVMSAGRSSMATAATISVALGSRSYDVLIGPGLLRHAAELIEARLGRAPARPSAASSRTPMSLPATWRRSKQA